MSELRKLEASSPDSAAGFFAKAKWALEKASSVDELMSIRNQAEALRAYYRQSCDSLAMSNACATLKLRADRRMGEILAQAIPHQGGRPQQKPSHEAMVSEGEAIEVAPTLAELGVSPSQSSRFQTIAKIPEPIFERYVDSEQRDPSEEITTAGLLRTAKKSGVLGAMFSSESEEWYTPAKYIEAARKVMHGMIELDPASCAKANSVVKAARFFTANQDGLSQPWKAGTLYMNPPYGSSEEGRSNQDIWSKRLVAEYGSGNIKEAVVLVNAATASSWFARLWEHSICFVAQRIRFEKPDGKPGPSPTHASVFVYLGQQRVRFAEEFGQFGPVVLPSESREGMILSIRRSVRSIQQDSAKRPST